jgi:hypothetical protein
VKGSSVAVMSSELNGPRHHFTFPRAIEASLYAAGRPAEVRNLAVVGGRTGTALLEWERETLAFSPDVVVLAYGVYESIHLALPWWFERHANSVRGRPRPIRDLYRKYPLRATWMTAAKLQSRIDGRLTSTPLSGGPDQVAADLERLIERIREVGRPLVLIPELMPPNARGDSWFPGMRPRVAAMNAALADLVARVDDPEVRMFSVPETARQLPPDEDPVPDSIHYSAELHHLVGQGMADEILAWAQTQEHLRPPAG